MSDEVLKRKYLYYKGRYYDVGTVLKIKTRWNGIQEVTFYRWGTCPFSEDGVYDQYYYFDVEKYIVEIVKPVYPKPENSEGRFGSNRDCPPSWRVETAWIWYILIMVVGAIFKDRLLIWTFATGYFILWKKGYIK